MNPLMAVIADDLTGVCDTGAQFALNGLRTVGSVDWKFRSAAIPKVVIVNTQSRSMGPEEAFPRVRKAAIDLKRLKPNWFLKKIDTALRGNIAVEISSMMESLEVETVIYVASIPGAGRTTVNGIQFFHGVPIKETIHGHDLLNPNPVLTSSNLELFESLAGVETDLVNLEAVRSGALDIRDRLNGTSRKVIIFDSETDIDIDRIVSSSMRLEPRSFLYVGSFGLSAALGRYLRPSLRRAGKEPKLFSRKGPFFKNRKVLIVSGSSHPMARLQLSHVAAKKMAEVLTFEPEDILKRARRCAGELLKAWASCTQSQKNVAITISEGRPGRAKQSQGLVRALAGIATSLFRSYEPDGLVLIGGETGYAVCHALRIRSIELLGNISFVAAYGKPLGAQTNMKILVTKGGSLGEKATLEEILRFIGAMS